MFISIREALLGWHEMQSLIIKSIRFQNPAKKSEVQSFCMFGFVHDDQRNQASVLCKKQWLTELEGDNFGFLREDLFQFQSKWSYKEYPNLNLSAKVQSPQKIDLVPCCLY